MEGRIEPLTDDKTIQKVHQFGEDKRLNKKCMKLLSGKAGSDPEKKRIGGLYRDEKASP